MSEDKEHDALVLQVPISLLVSTVRNHEGFTGHETIREI